MLKKAFLFIVLIIYLSINCGYAQSEINFYLPNFPPFTYEKDSKIQGIGVELVSRIFNEAGIKHSLTVTSNYRRAVEYVRAGKSDGFFLATQNAERDEIAVFSNPVFINRWCWFLKANSTLNPKDSTFKTKAKIGTHLNTNTHIWLTTNGYNVVGSPSRIGSLIKMFNIGRIDAIFIAELVFFEAANEAGISLENYKKIIEVEKPFGIYISKDYLSKHPGIMDKINTTINNVVKFEN